MTLAQAPVNFRCPRADQFSVQRWPDGEVVYDDADGSLHALTPVAGEAFAFIRTGHVSDVHALALAMDLAQPEPEELHLLESLLQQFESMGLIECIQP